jgi:hypothetical protein
MLVQAIVYGELSQKDAKGCLKHQRLLLDSLAFANSNLTLFPGVDVVELAVEIVTVKLAHLVAPNITGYVHVQVNPRYCYDKDKLMKNAKSM